MEQPQIVGEWLDHQRYRGLSQRSVQRRQWSLRAWTTYTQGEYEKVTQAQVESFLMRWKAPASRRAVLSDLAQFYEWAVKRQLLAVNPVSDVDKPKVPSRRPTPVGYDDVVLLLNTTAQPVRAMIALAALAGLRVFEIAALTTHDVNLRDGILTVRGGKGGKDAMVPVAPRLAFELAGWPEGRYFPGLSARHVSYRIQREMRYRDIGGRPHDLRAAFGTELAKLTNGNLVLVKQLMRHESVQTTMRYVGWTPEAARYVAQLFAA